MSMTTTRKRRPARAAPPVADVPPLPPAIYLRTPAGAILAIEPQPGAAGAHWVLSWWTDALASAGDDLTVIGRAIRAACQQAYPEAGGLATVRLADWREELDVALTRALTPGDAA